MEPPLPSSRQTATETATSGRVLAAKSKSAADQDIKSRVTDLTHRRA